MSGTHPFLVDLGRPLVLASASPRRAEILRAQGLRFQVEPADVPEEMVEGEAFDHFATRVARDKAHALARRRREAVVLGADTIVVLDGTVLMKPRDAAEAVAMLSRLSGRTHTVVTGVALACDAAGFRAAQCQRSEVRFRTLAAAEIDAYVATGEPLDKAGAYGIQGYGAMMVERLEGCYFNVMGLPLATLLELWRECAAALVPSNPSQGEATS